MTPSSSRGRELVGGAIDRASAWASYATAAQSHRRRTFIFAGDTYRYHAAMYNRTWTNERTVELPVALGAIARLPHGRVLEVGNVLAHYGAPAHTVVDKYETADGVLNLDILDYRDERGFDLIVSISTLEHTGFEEEVDEPDKPARVVRHLAGLLTPGGRGGDRRRWGTTRVWTTSSPASPRRSARCGACAGSQPTTGGRSAAWMTCAARGTVTRIRAPTHSWWR